FVRNLDIIGESVARQFSCIRPRQEGKAKYCTEESATRGAEHVHFWLTVWSRPVASVSCCGSVAPHQKIATSAGPGLVPRPNSNRRSPCAENPFAAWTSRI